MVWQYTYYSIRNYNVVKQSFQQLHFYLILADAPWCVCGRRGAQFEEKNKASKFLLICLCLGLKHAVTNHSEYKENKHNAVLQWTDPGTNVTGDVSIKGPILSPNAQNGLLLFPSF